MSEAVAHLLAGIVSVVLGAQLLAIGVSRVWGRDFPGLDSTLAGLAVCVAAAVMGHPALAVGVVIGRGAAAVGLVLGIATVVRPLTVSAGVVKGGVVLVIATTLVFWALAADNALNRDDGIVMLVGCVAVVVGIVWKTRGRHWPVPAHQPKRRWLCLVIAAGGSGLLLYGAYETVADTVALSFGKAGTIWLFGLTAVAAATSLPGVLSAAADARHGKAEAAYAGVVAGAVLNLLLVLGVTIVITPVKLSNAVVLREVPAMVLFCLLLLTALANGYRVHRGEGVVMIAAYIACVVWEVTRSR
jgi:cation:H+ antiporter